MNLINKTALVTGGERGIGKAFTKWLRSQGVYVHSLSKETGDIICDLSDREQRQKLKNMPRVIENIDILINNAGINLADWFVDMKWEDLMQVMQVNLFAPIELSQMVAPHMIKRGYGKIINICSVSSFQGARKITPYVVSKHGLVGLTKIMSNELAPHNIQVNGIAPGLVKTDMIASLISQPERMKEQEDRTPAGRLGETEDLIPALKFFLEADYVTGTIQLVDGGWMAR